MRVKIQNNHNNDSRNNRNVNKAIAGGAVGLIILFVVLPLLLVGGIGLGTYALVQRSLAGMDQRHKVGPVVVTKDGSLITVVENEKTTSYSRRGNFTTRSVSSTYSLQSNRVNDGNRITEAELGSGRGMIRHSPQLLGYTPPLIWVLTDRLKGFDAATLKEVASEKTLSEKNPTLAGKFVHDSAYGKFYRVDPSGKHLLLTTNDGYNYTIDPKTLIATETEAPSDRLTEGLRLAADLMKSDRDPSQLTVGGVRNANEFLWIGTRPEWKNGVHSYSRFGESARRTLWAAPFRKERYAEKVGEIVARNANNTFLGGAFLTASADAEGLLTALTSRDSLEDFAAKNRAEREALRLSDPHSYLILHVDRIDDEGRLLLSRVKPDGTVLWTAAMPIRHKRIADIRVAGSHALFFGQNEDDSSDEASKMVGIRLSDGKTYAYDYKENRVLQP